MKTIPVLIPDDLHKQFRLKLYQEDRTSKEFFLTAIQVYVKGDPAGPKIEDEEPENPDPAIKVLTVGPVIESKSEDKKSEEEIGHEKKRRTRRNQPGGKEKNGGKGSPSVPREKKGGDPPEPGPRRKRGIWPWAR